MGLGFEYRYRFSVDEDIISRFGSWYGEDLLKYIFETRTSFIVRGRFDDGDDVERITGSERFEVAVFEGGDDKGLRECMGIRLKDYWMPDDEIERLLNEALLFAAADGRRGIIPVAVDLDVCTVQREGEAVDAVVDRAMRPEVLYPIYLCPLNQLQRPEGYEGDIDVMHFLVAAIRVEEDMEREGLCVCLVWELGYRSLNVVILSIVRWLEWRITIPAPPRQDPMTLTPILLMRNDCNSCSREFTHTRQIRRDLQQNFAI